MTEHTPEPLIYAAWMRRAEAAADPGRARAAARRWCRRPTRSSSSGSTATSTAPAAWCDVRQTTAIETCAEMARLALDDALIELAEAYGPRLESWRWGDAHQAVHRHQTLGQRAGAAAARQHPAEHPGRRPHAAARADRPGTGRSPISTSTPPGSAPSTTSPIPTSSVFIIATGESGHLLSRHYDDLAALWRRAEYIPMSLDPAWRGPERSG